MDILQSFYESIKSFLPVSIAIVASVFVLYFVRYILEKKYAEASGQTLKRQIIILFLSFAAVLVVILAMPISDSSRGQLLSLIGILLSAAIALSSTTFVGNAMAGMMLRAVRSFKPGDFISVGDHFGRVSGRGLFHIEIQTEFRDLTTMPNMYLITNPVKVIRASGTIVVAEVSLGYDIPRTRIEQLLLEAATAAELEEPFVQVTKLGDFSVTYRVAGLLTEVKQLISARSRLREMVLDSLHKGKVEIVSPTFMNTRAIPEKRTFIPYEVDSSASAEKDKSSPEDIVFDKAEQAESLEKMRERYEMLGKELESIKDRLKEADDETVTDELDRHREWIETRRKRLSEVIKKKESEEKTE